MADKRFKWGMTALALALGMTFLGACASSSAYTVLDEQPKPDGRSAIVVFLGSNSTKAQVWDGEKPVGTFRGTPGSSMNCIHWRATPGAHTFVGRSTNFVHVKMNVQANRTYYIRVHEIPAPYATPIAMNEVSKQQYDEFRERWRIKDLEFDDEWRRNFLDENDGKWQKDVREYLATAK